MSNFKKTSMAVAVFAAMGLPMVAGAVTTTYGASADDYTFARNIFGNAANTAANPVNLAISTEAGDGILGRTTGFNISISLSQGKFAADPTIGVGGVTVGAGLPDSDTPDSWTITKAGGGNGATTLTLAINPPATGTGYGVIEGDLINWAAGDLKLTNLTGLGTAGAKVTATIKIQDPVGGGILATITQDLIVSAEGVVVAYDKTAGDTDSRIDVGANGTYESKTSFSPDGSIANAADTVLFDAGKLTISANGLADGFTGANNQNGTGAGDFGYDTANDAFTTKVTGTNFEPFAGANGVFLSVNQNCSTQDVVGTLNTAKTEATFSYVLDDIGGAKTGGSAYVCFQADGDTVIDAQDLTASTSVDLDDAAVLDPVSAYAGDLLSMDYNGSVVKVFTFNPAGNTTQQSLLRISNTGTVGGKVTVHGVDDTGTAGAADVTFDLAKGNSVLLLPEDLENGNASKGLTGAMGDGAGKWRLTVTGEFDGMIVTSLNRNNNSGTVTNLTDADSATEQKNEGK